LKRRENHLQMAFRVIEKAVFIHLKASAKHWPQEFRSLNTPRFWDPPKRFGVTEQSLSRSLADGCGGWFCV
jgi:hypothetical protein